MIHARTPGCHPCFRRHGCMDDLTAEQALIHKATWIIDVLGLFVDIYPRVFVQSGTGKRPVDWCRN